MDERPKKGARLRHYFEVKLGSHYFEVKLGSPLALRSGSGVCPTP